MQSTPFFPFRSSDLLIQKWLNERQELIVTFHQLCQFRPFAHNCDRPLVLKTLQEFCQILLDYVSLGHFEVFEHITHTIETYDHPIVQVSSQLLEKLLQTTDCVLDFNDKYQHPIDLTHIEKDLSKLGEIIAQRFEWEDKLIEKFTLAKSWAAYPAKSA